jgi:RNA exonuclease 4
MASTPAIFFTKKQKKLMRERRKKRKLARKDEEPLPETKAMPPSTTASVPANASRKRKVALPQGLSSKEAKLFRKKTRRKAREEGYDVDFVEERPKKKKRFSINELVQQQQKQKEHAAQAQTQLEQEAQLSEEYKSRYVALDCEMVGIHNNKSVLARVSLVDWDGHVLLDTFVKVPDKITDFRTKYSGVKPQHLKNAMEPAECRKRVAALLRSKVLVGHALKNDLDVLLLQHPKQDIRDTAKYRPFQKFTNKWRPRKLRELVKERLEQDIQEASHDSVEDARATMKLFRTVRHEWES